MKKTAILLLHCPDQPGIISEMTRFITDNKGNIVYLDQYVDKEEGMFFMRIEWELEGFVIPREKIKDYIKGLTPELVTDRAICFGSSWLTRRPVYLIQEKVKDQGITVAPQALYARGNPKQIILDAAEVFAEMEVNRNADDDAARPKPYIYVVKADERNEAAALAEEDEEYDEDDKLDEEE